MSLHNYLANKVIFYQGKNFQIVNYGFFYGLAAFFVSQVFYVLWGTLQGDLSPGFLLFIAIIVPLSTLIFSKIIYLLYNTKRLLKTPLGVMNETGYAFFGGFFGIFISVYLASIYFYPGRAMELLDVLFLCVPIGQIFQRIGCMTYGCCYGSPYDGHLAVSFSDPRSKAHREIGGNIKIHPTQFYSILKNIAIFMVLLTLFMTLPYQGLTFSMWLILYGLLRFFIDFTRHHNKVFIYGLRYSQLFSILIFFIGLILLTQVQPINYEFTTSVLSSFMSSWKYIPYSIISFVIFFIGYGYHSKVLGYYVSPK